MLTREFESASADARGWFPKRFGRGLTVGVVGAILVAGLSLSALLYRQAEDMADRQETALTTRVSRVVQSTSAALVASVSGANAIVGDDGRVDHTTFDRFAAGAVASTLLPVLAYVQPVPDADRAAVEAALGRSITEVGPDGALRPAARRPSYLVVRFVYPASSTSTSVLGFDINSEPARAAAATAALQSGSVVYSAPIASQPTGQPGFFAIRPLFRQDAPIETSAERAAASAGFVSSLVPARELVAQMLDQLPAGARVSISDGATLLGGTESLPTDGHERTLADSGRVWTIDVEYHHADHATAVFLAIATLVLAAGVWLFLWRNMRHTMQLRDAALSVRQLGQLSELLASADSREDVARVILSAASSTVGAAYVTIAIRLADPTMLTARRSAGPTDPAPAGDDLPPPLQLLVASNPSPITDAWNTRHPVFISDDAAYRGLYADGMQDRDARGVVSVAALPMRRPNGELLGVIAWEWTTPSRFAPGLRSTLQATAEVCQQSLNRADLHEQEWDSASALSALSQRLAVARNIRQIAEAAIQLGPEAGGADYVAACFLAESATLLDVYYPAAGVMNLGSLQIPIDPNGPIMAVLRRGQPVELYGNTELDRFPELIGLLQIEMKRIVCVPLIDSESQLRGAIAFAFAASSPVMLQVDTGRLTTIGELTAQTVERAMLYLHEHELVINLQRQTLGELPTVEGVSMAARYLPSSATIGLGGDWYDVHPLGDGVLGLVVGDVSGHGIDAIADMTEFRTTISTLMRTDHALGSMPALSTALLNEDAGADVRFATAGLMMLDVRARRLRFVRAGHPPMLVRHADGRVEILELGGGGPIGVETSPIAEQTVQLDPGAIVVAYTDGLIERREETLDVGLARLRRALCEFGSHGRPAAAVGENPAQAIVDWLIEQCVGDRLTADDAAVLVAVLQ
jgi:CHASE1-domain containing sensor protein/GAF domain-containing protein